MDQIIINQAFVGLLYENGEYTKLLKPGMHKFKDPVQKSRGFFQAPVELPRIDRSVVRVDVRQRSLTIKGQEILTIDKVAIRVSLLVYFKVEDAVAAVHNVASYEERIYEDVQLAARRYLASKSLDEILNDRNEISDNVRDVVMESAASYGVTIVRADVKDLVFPGNLREIMNQVLETERRAEAKLIQARKDAEVARIKSEADQGMEVARLKAEMEQLRMQAQANQETERIALEGELEQAKALAEHPDLIKLKQLEVLKQLAQTGNGKFVIGFNGKDLSGMIE